MQAILLIDVLTKLSEDPHPENATDASEFSILFDNALEELDQVWIEGVLRWISKEHPDLMQTINEQFDEFETAWRNRNMEHFKEALEFWKISNLKALELYRENLIELHAGFCPIGLRLCDRLDYYPEFQITFCTDDSGNATNINIMEKCPLDTPKPPVAAQAA